MVREKKDFKLPEFLRKPPGSSKTAEGSHGPLSPVESLANSLGEEEQIRPGRRTLTLRYDTVLILLITVLVMMVVSYVLGVVAGQRKAGIDRRGAQRVVGYLDLAGKKEKIRVAIEAREQTENSERESRE